MVRASLALQNEPNQETWENISPKRVPALHLGPPLVGEKSIESPREPQAEVRRKPGRPPGKKMQASSPEKTIASSQRKRKFQQTKTNPTRLRPATTAPHNGSGSRDSQTKTGTSRGAGRNRESSQNSDNQPICNMIPATMKRKKADFQNPSTLGP